MTDYSPNKKKMQEKMSSGGRKRNIESRNTNHYMKYLNSQKRWRGILQRWIILDIHQCHVFWSLFFSEKNNEDLLDQNKLRFLFSLNTLTIYFLWIRNWIRWKKLHKQAGFVSMRHIKVKKYTNIYEVG